MGVRDESIVYFDGVLKILGVCHGILGGLLIVMGVVVRLAVDHWTSVMLLGLWIGVIIAATGGIAVIDSNMEKADNSKKYYLLDFLMFSVISLLLSIMLVVCYSMAVHTAFTSEEVGSFSWYSYDNYQNQNMTRAKAFSVIMLTLGCLEFLLCVGSIGYVTYAYKRDQKRKPRRVPAGNPRRAPENPYSYVNETYG